MTPPAVRLDPEVVELLRDSPDLLAVADAIAVTQQVPAARRVWRGPLRVAAVAAIVALAALVSLVSPWPGGGGGFVERALAALGAGAVIHVVSAGEVPGQTLVDLRTGVESPVQTETEIWFDGERGLERVVTRVNGAVTMEELQTPAGAWTREGRVYTCAWIAAHPVQATKARVSCSASGDNGTTPRRVAEPRPVLDPALGGFVSGYREALAKGSATRDGAGVVDGRRVEWLRFVSPLPPGSEAGELVERVAVDAETLKPVRVERLVDGVPAGETRIATVETLDAQGVDFSRPQQTPKRDSPVATSVTGEVTVSLEAAAAALEGKLLTAGATLDGLPRGPVTLRTIVTGYGADSGLPPTRSQAVELRYGGPIDRTANADYLLVKLSLEPQMLYRFVGAYREPPPEGTMVLQTMTVSAAAPGTTRAVPTGETIWLGQLRKSGVYVTIEATSKTLLIDAARALTRWDAR